MTSKRELQSIYDKKGLAAILLDQSVDGLKWGNVAHSISLTLRNDFTSKTIITELLMHMEDETMI